MIIWFSFRFGLVWFYSISTIVRYLMSNPISKYILNLWLVTTFCRYTHLNDQTVLFLKIPFSISQQSFQWFPALLSIINNSIKHQSFVYAQLNDQTVLFLTIQFNASYFYALSLNVKQFYLTHNVDLGVMVMKEYSTFPKTAALLEPHHQIA